MRSDTRSGRGDGLNGSDKRRGRALQELLLLGEKGERGEKGGRGRRNHLNGWRRDGRREND
jgi:hypothetical protein